MEIVPLVKPFIQIRCPAQMVLIGGKTKCHVIIGWISSSSSLCSPVDSSSATQINSGIIHGTYVFLSSDCIAVPTKSHRNRLVLRWDAQSSTLGYLVEISQVCFSLCTFLILAVSTTITHNTLGAEDEVAPTSAPKVSEGQWGQTPSPGIFLSF